MGQRRKKGFGKAVRESKVAGRSRLWLAVVGVATLLALGVNFGRIIEYAQDMRESRREKRCLVRIEEYLAYGRLAEAQSALASACFHDNSSMGKRARLLVDAFVGSQSWDSVDEKGRSNLRSELAELPQDQTSREALVLLDYRLSQNVELPAVYFKGVVHSLLSPWARFLAARESHVSDPAWSAAMLDSVVETIPDSVCALGIQARIWLSHVHRRLDMWDRVATDLEPVERRFLPCSDAHDNTIEVKMRGELLRFARQQSDSTAASEQRRALVDLVRRKEKEGSDGAMATALNARYWIADDSFEAGALLEALRQIEPALNALEKSPAQRDSYPYVFAKLELLWAQCRIRQGDYDAKVRGQLENAASSFKRLSLKSGGPFWDDEALCHYLITELCYRESNRDEGDKSLRNADELAARCRKQLGGFDFEAEAERVRDLILGARPDM